MTHITTTQPIAALLQQASQQLESITDSPLLDAQLLLADSLNKERSYLMAWSEITPTERQVEQFNRYLEQRITGVPIAYILGYKEFWSMSFIVTPDVLIPRPETELLVEQVINACSHFDKPTILELGTGSGAIAIALGKELPSAEITATDISNTALDIARQNALSQQINNIQFIYSDWFSNVQGRFDIIVSNPPYIEVDDPHLNNEIRFEPMLALVSGIDGLDDIRTILTSSDNYLREHGMLLLEHGYNQGGKLRELMEKTGLHDYQTIKDYSSNDRITIGARGKGSASDKQ